jgi:chorismate mutase-like protein
MNDANKKLGAIRREIDELDHELLALINRRARLAKKVAEVKDDEGSARYYRPEREAEVLRSLVVGNDGPLPGGHVARIFQEIMSACRALQKPLSVAYLGPEGTFSERAALKHFGHAIDSQPVDSIGAVFRQVESGGGDYGVVPIENSTEGVVGHTLDMFVSSGLSICGEVELSIHPDNSTRLASSIEDEPGNTTRFVVIGRQAAGATGRDKTSVLFSSKDRPGALYELLQSFKKRGINMTRIESRPSRRGNWSYVFYVDFDGHAADANVGAALAELEELAPFFKFLGSYPRCDP